MKTFGIIIVFIASSLGAIAQITYESPYVYGDSTFQIEIPEELYQHGLNEEKRKVVIFTSDSVIGLEQMDIENLTMDLLIFSYTDVNELTLEKMLVKMERRLDLGDSDVNLTFLQEPTIVSRNGNEFAILGVTGQLDELVIEEYYMAMTAFGDYFFGMIFIGPTKNSVVSTKDDLFEVLDTFQIIATDRENQLE